MADINDPDFWYIHRHDLESGQVFWASDGSVVKLDRRVPGDGTKWYVAYWCNGWSYCDNEVEPGDLRGDPLVDFQEVIERGSQHVGA